MKTIAEKKCKFNKNLSNKKTELNELLKKMSEKKNPRNLELISASVDIKEEP